MAHVNPKRLERCAGELEDVYQVIYNTSSNHANIKDDSGSITGGKVIKVEQKGGKKPHYAIVDNTGREVFETTAYPSAMRKRLEKLENREVISYTWSSAIIPGHPTEYAPQTLGVLKIKPIDRPKPTEPPIEAIYFDTETTGLDPECDEIIQLSIVDQDGNTLWDRRYKPIHVRDWAEAAAINHITPDDVAGRPPIEEGMNEIQQIFDRAKKAYAWNAIFDLAFLARAGLKFARSKSSDSMISYAQLKGRTHYYKLEKAALECGYTYDAHDSLEDTKALKVVQDYIDGKNKRKIQKLKPLPQSKPAVKKVAHPQSAPAPAPQPIPQFQPVPQLLQATTHRVQKDRKKSIIHGICLTFEIIFALIIALFVAMILTSLNQPDVILGAVVMSIPFIALLALCEWERRKNKQ